ncbi:MAG: TlpA family protein disulfide reductase [Gluconacetobacter diazotrophicus]|nr:TlpA family protein disulfide reductase [Gluconacetobacter diazotrophicus]
MVIGAPDRRTLLGAMLLGLLSVRAPAADVAVGDGRPVPDIPFGDGENRHRRLSDFAGRPVVLNLWATWCGPCRRELPALSEFAAALQPDGVAVIPVATDCRRAGTVRTFLDENKVYDLPVFTDPDGRVLSILGVHGIPTTLLLDRDHRLLMTVVGELDWSDPQATGSVRKLLLRPASV